MLSAFIRNWMIFFSQNSFFNLGNSFFFLGSFFPLLVNVLFSTSVLSSCIHSCYYHAFMVHMPWKMMTECFLDEKFCFFLCVFETENCVCFSLGCLAYQCWFSGLLKTILMKMMTTVRNFLSDEKGS